jgi:3-dehydroquinate dehydratase-2
MTGPECTRTGRPIFILNGPNLNRLGTREPDIYGRTTLAEVEAMCREAADRRAIVFRQSNREYELIEWVHEAIDEACGLIINPAAFTFTSMALMDALKMFPGPIFELHVSNIHRREPVYHRSLVSPVATAVIAGLGTLGYPTAVRAMCAMTPAGPAGAVNDPLPGPPP